MRRALFGTLLLLAIAWSVGPFLWSVLTSLKTPEELFKAPPTYLPRALSLDSYTGVFERRPFGLYLLNSLIVAAGSTLLVLLLAAPAAHRLARMRKSRATPIERGFLLFALFPPAVLLVPLFTAARTLGLTNSPIGLIIVHAAINIPFAVWSLTAFFRQLPAEVEEAGRIDGFTSAGVLTRIVLPLAAPALAATGILVFIFSWNEFVIALTFIQRDSLRTVPVGISMLSGATVYEIPWGQISAAVVMTTLPVVVAVLALQRWILSGLTAGAVKG